MKITYMETLNSSKLLSKFIVTFCKLETIYKMMKETMSDKPFLGFEFNKKFSPFDEGPLHLVLLCGYLHHGLVLQH